jgi:hypothetical protein
VSVSDLTKEEQDHVREALRFLHIRFGTNKLLGKALHCKKDSIQQLVMGKYAVSANMAFKVSLLAAVSFDDVTSGRWLVKGMCPHCGRAARLISCVG